MLNGKRAFVWNILYLLAGVRVQRLFVTDTHEPSLAVLAMRVRLKFDYVEKRDVRILLIEFVGEVANAPDETKAVNDG